MNIVYHVRVIKAVAVRDFKIRITYIPWIMNSLLQPIAWTLILVYAYRSIMGPGSREILTAHGWAGDPVGFLVLGQVLLSLFNALNWRAGMAIQRERWYGTLELILQAPASRIAVLAGSSLFGLVDAGWASFLSALAVIALTNATFNIVDPLAAATSVALAAVGALSMGVGLAGLYVLTRSAGPIAIAIQHPTRFFTGSSFPLAILPAVLQYVGYAIPLTYGLEAVRMTMLQGAGLSDVEPLLYRLLILSLASSMLGVAMVRWAEEVARRNGWLHTF
ncbi:MAG: ABC transporter permease [Desulfurococcales archaeon]|nr:ABC transporter permease [Desulfurococcales archaeon]